MSLRDVSDFDRRHDTPLGQRWWLIAIVVSVYVGGMAAFVWFILPATGLGLDVERRVFAGFAVFTALYTGLLAMLVWRSVARRVRIDRVASSLGFSYSSRAPLSRFAGTVLARAGNHFATDVVVDESPVGEIGLMAATFAPGTGSTLRRAACLQVRLDRQTPHIVLLNRRSRVLNRSDSRILSAQRLGLEGDFDRTFTLYCPAGYERDALYIFTPDLMALLLDVASDCEIELVDGWLIAYTGRPWGLWQGRNFARVVALADAVAAKARRQTRRYQDDRALPRLVGAAGRRLRARPSAGAVLSLIAPVALGIVGAVAWFAP